jgi:tRNA (guanine-N7-)-methyltransferase
LGSKNKLKRFKENLSLKNLFQPTRSELLSNSFRYKGLWNDYFDNNNPIVLELGCGKGEYTCSLAEKYPKYAVVNSIENACFIRTQIELIEFLFSENEISEMWITFPDPQIKIQRQKHRLTNINFLNRYKNIIKSKGIIHLKTDSEFLHGYTLGLIEALNLKLIQSNHDIYLNQNVPEDVVDIKTHYEKIFLDENKKITYLSFQIK